MKGKGQNGKGEWITCLQALYIGFKSGNEVAAAKEENKRLISLNFFNKVSVGIGFRKAIAQRYHFVFFCFHEF